MRTQDPSRPFSVLCLEKQTASCFVTHNMPPRGCTNQQEKSPPFRKAATTCSVRLQAPTRLPGRTEQVHRLEGADGGAAAEPCFDPPLTTRPFMPAVFRPSCVRRHLSAPAAAPPAAAATWIRKRAGSATAGQRLAISSGRAAARAACTRPASLVGNLRARGGPRSETAASARTTCRTGRRRTVPCPKRYQCETAQQTLVDITAVLLLLRHCSLLTVPPDLLPACLSAV